MTADTPGVPIPPRPAFLRERASAGGPTPQLPPTEAIASLDEMSETPDLSSSAQAHADVNPLASPVFVVESLSVVVGDDDEVADASFWKTFVPSFLVSTACHCVALLIASVVLAAFFTEPETTPSLTLLALPAEDEEIDVDLVTDEFVVDAPRELATDAVSDHDGPDGVDLASIDALDLPQVDTAPPALNVFNVAAGKVEGEGTGSAVEGTGTGGRMTKVKFFGVEAEGKSYVFVVDRSGSMNGHRFAMAKGELVRALTRIQPHQQYLVIFYETQTLPLFAPRTAGLIDGDPRNLARTLKVVRALTSGGGTQPQDALRLALALKPHVVFFMTDGEIPPETPQIVHEHRHRQTKVHTVCLQNRFGEIMMRTIAHESGGRYRFVP